MQQNLVWCGTDMGFHLMEVSNRQTVSAFDWIVGTDFDFFFCQNLLSTRSSVDHIFGSQCTRAWSRVLDPVWSVWSSGFFASELRGWMLDRFFLFLVGQVHAQRLSISVMNPVNCDLKAGDCGPLIESWNGMQMKGGGVKSDFFFFNWEEICGRLNLCSNLFKIE